MTAKFEQITRFIKDLPENSLEDALTYLSTLDPVVFAGFYRKVKGWPLAFDYSKHLIPEELLKIQKANPSKQAYEREKKGRLLRHRPFLIDPLRDDHPHKVYEKSRQVGISELSLTEVIWFLYVHGGKWVIAFPRDTQLKDFSNTRISEAFKESKRLSALLTGTDQTYSKKIGNGYLLLRSAWESNLGEGIDADGVTLDEKDRMKVGIEIAFWESLQSSKFGWKREISTPTVPNRGIDIPFKLSDQRIWLVRCVTCNLEQEIEYPTNIQQQIDFPQGTKELPEGAYEFVCRKELCRGPLNRLKGRWVARYPDKVQVRGYHITQLIAPWITATDVMQRKIRYKHFQLFSDYVLGSPAKGENILLSDDDIDAISCNYGLFTRRTDDWEDVSVGIDWGHLNWVVVKARNRHNNKPYVIGLAVREDNYSRELDSVKEIDQYIEPFQPDIICADHGYGKDRNTYLARKYPNFFAVTYNPSTKSSKTFKPQFIESSSRVIIDRTSSLKTYCRAIQDLEFGIPSLELELVKTYQKHLLALAPLKHMEEGQEDNENAEITEEITSTGPDHFAHAGLFSYLGLDRLLGTNGFDFEFL